MGGGLVLVLMASCDVILAPENVKATRTSTRPPHPHPSSPCPYRTRTPHPSFPYSVGTYHQGQGAGRPFRLLIVFGCQYPSGRYSIFITTESGSFPRSG